MIWLFWTHTIISCHLHVIIKNLRFLAVLSFCMLIAARCKYCVHWETDYLITKSPWKTNHCAVLQQGCFCRIHYLPISLLAKTWKAVIRLDIAQQENTSCHVAVNKIQGPVKEMPSAVFMLTWFKQEQLSLLAFYVFSHLHYLLCVLLVMCFQIQVM